MRRAVAGVVSSLFLLCVAPSFASTSDSHPIWGDLEPGPMPVGFRVHQLRDVSRMERPLATLEGKPQRTPPGRAIEILMWYPARSPQPNQTLRFGDYLSHADDVFDVRSDDRRDLGDLRTRRDNALHALATYAIFTGIPESAWSGLAAVRMRGVRDAPAAAGRFPIVLFAPGALGNAALSALTCEYLASHGYVVLSAPSRGLDALNDRISGGAFYESQVRDLEYLLNFASGAGFADLERIGVIGYSRGGAAAILLAMRNSLIAAVVSWDSPSVDSKRDSERLRESPFHDPDRLTVPLLHVRMRRSDAPPALFESIRFAPKYLLTVDGLHHIDLSTIAMLHTTLGARNEYVKSPPEYVRTAHASINEFTRRFLDAFVKDRANRFDAGAAVEALRPAAAFTLTKSEASAARPSPALLLERILSRNGISSARTYIQRARQASPDWNPFPEHVLKGISERMFELGRGDEAVQVLLLNADLYSLSSGAWTALGVAQRKTGHPDDAVRSFRRALEIDPGNEAAATALRGIDGSN